MSKPLGKFTMNPFKWVLLLLSIGFFAVIGWRIAVGIGGVTNLSDSNPWGLWKIWDVVVYVPLGAAGFTLAFVRYILKDERYEGIARRAVAWAAIAYSTAGLRLMFDIGIWWRLPKPLLVSRNTQSALLEVAWCMALYLIVLFLENAPRLMERSNKQWILRAEHTLHKVLPAFVLGGVLLSTMHQSSLGTVFMILGKRIDPLWYHPWLNYMFLLTGIAAGLGVAIVIEALTNKYYKTKFQTHLLSRLGLGMLVSLVITFVWRIYSMAVEGSLGHVFDGRLGVLSWWVEIITLYLLPIAILAFSSMRNSQRTLTIAAASTVFGMVVYRMNVGILGLNAAMKSTYVPSIPEVLFSVGATAFTVLLFTYLVEVLPAILGKGEHAAHGKGTLTAAADD